MAVEELRSAVGKRLLNTKAAIASCISEKSQRQIFEQQKLKAELKQHRFLVKSRYKQYS